jgi:outer membrane protein TolC
MARGPWLCFFFLIGLVRAQEPLTWERCVILTAEHNNDLKQAQTKFLEADGQIVAYRAIFYPKVRATALSIPATLTFQVSQTIYDHRAMAQQRIGRLGKDAARINLELTLRTVSFRLRQAFIRALYALEVEKLRVNYAARLERLTKAAPDLFTAGKLTKASVTRYEVRTELARNTVQQAHEEAIQRRIDLDEIMGISLSPPPRLEGHFSEEEIGSLNLQILTTEALQKRRDLFLLENFRKTEFEQLIVTAAPFYPSAEIRNTTSLQPPGARFGSEFDPTASESLRQRDRHNARSKEDIGLNFSWRIFDGGETYGEKLIQENVVKSREELLENLRKAIPAQVEVAMSSVLSSRRSLEAFRDRPTAADFQSLANEQFNAGNATSLDLLDTEDKVLNQSLTRLAAQRDLELSMNQLNFALGRDVELTTGPAEKSAVRP